MSSVCTLRNVCCGLLDLEKLADADAIPALKFSKGTVEHTIIGSEGPVRPVVEPLLSTPGKEGPIVGSHAVGARKERWGSSYSPVSDALAAPGGSYQDSRADHC